jgi:RND family efflux transporter MFP subunit
LTIALFALAIAATIFFVTRRQSSTAADAETAAPQQTDMVQLSADGKALAGIKTVVLRYGAAANTLLLSGTCEEDPSTKAVVTTPVSGQLIRLHAKVGDRVRQGQTLATLASRDVAELQSSLIRARAEEQAALSRLKNIRAFAKTGALTKKPLEEAENAVTTDAASVKQADAALARARAGRDLAANDLARKKKLAAAHAYQARPVEDAQSAVNEAQAEVESATATLKVKQSAYDRSKRLLDAGIAARRDVEGAEADLDEARARDKEARTHLGIVKQTLAREEKIAGQNLYTSAEVQQAESALQQAEQDVMNCAAEQERAQGHLRVSQAVLARETEIAHQNLNANKEIQEAETAVTLAHAQVKATENAMNTLRAMGTLRSGNGANIPITAPISGVVTARAATPGQAVEAAAELFTIINTDTIIVAGNVYEKDIPALRVGQPVQVKVNAYPGRAFGGVVARMDTLLDETSRTMKIRCHVANANGRLKPGMFAELTVLADTLPNTLLLPEAAMQEDGDAKYVFVVDGAGYRKVSVQLGEASNGFHRVVSGLAAGDEVVTDGSFTLKSETKKSEMGEE